MREPPLDFSSQYDRPNQPWVCGQASEGRACPAGPTAAGQCPALAECVPLRDGGRWRCHRTALRGGVCDEGPTPEGKCGRVNRCQPVRSLRAIRGRIVTACALLAVGALVFMLSADWRDEVISPGPLARQHAQLLQNTGEHHGTHGASCAACHSAAEVGLAGWTAALVVGHGGRPSQSQLCMKCHESTIPAEFALAAHNLPPEVLRELREKGAKLFSGQTEHSKQMRRPEKSSDPFSLACATCHREHQGAAFDMTAMSNAACQACHQQRYESFATDHPDFGRWPYQRRTRIAFDHVSHSAKHFAERQQAFDCRTCHVEDATRSVQLLASYEAACASCHDERIATSVVRGVPMLVLPMLDVEALRAAGFDVGDWPEAATGDFDGRLPPLMKLLLAADPPAARAMATLGEDFEFFDVDPDDELQLAACADLASAIKTLLADLSRRGPAAVRERLTASLGREISDAELHALVAGMSIDTLRTAVSAWLPEETGSEDFSRADEATRRVATQEKSFDLFSSLAPAGAWFHDDATFSIRYRPAAHADPVLSSLLTLLVETPDVDRQPFASALLGELAGPTAPGLCASCHSVERAGPRQLAINWRAADRTAAPRTFTKFSHGPHLLLPPLADCTHCHALDPSASTAASYADRNPHTFVSEFQPISKQQCASCHTARAAGDRCQTCHNYHVEQIESWRLMRMESSRWD